MNALTSTPFWSLIYSKLENKNISELIEQMQSYEYSNLPIYIIIQDVNSDEDRVYRVVEVDYDGEDKHIVFDNNSDFNDFYRSLPEGYICTNLSYMPSSDNHKWIVFMEPQMTKIIKLVLRNFESKDVEEQY